MGKVKDLSVTFSFYNFKHLKSNVLTVTKCIAVKGIKQAKKEQKKERLLP